MKTLKFGLYVILSTCVFWGLAVILGPTIIGLALSKYFDEDQLRVTGLNVSPKLHISATQAEFSLNKNGKLFQGLVRAPKIKIFFTTSGWTIQLNAGLVQVNDDIKLPSLKIDFHSNSITKIGSGMAFLSIPKISVTEYFELSDIAITSQLELLSSELRSLTFNAKSAHSNKPGESILFNLIKGELDHFSMSEDLKKQLLNFKMSIDNSQVNSEQFGFFDIMSILLEASNDGKNVYAVFNADNLKMSDNKLFLKGIKAYPSVDYMPLAFKNEIFVEIDRGFFKLSEPTKASGNLQNLEAELSLKPKDRFLKLSSNFSDLEIWNNQFPIIGIPEMDLNIKATLSPAARVQNADVDLSALVNGNNDYLVKGGLAAALHSTQSQDCLMKNCEISDFSFYLKHEVEGEHIILKGNCPDYQCAEKIPTFTLETSNTPEIIERLTKLKIVNPLALFMFSGSIIKGKEVGSGHIINF